MSLLATVRAAGGEYVPPRTWPVPPGFLEKYEPAAGEVLQRAVELAGGDPQRVARDMFLQALEEKLQLSSSEYDYAKRVSLAVMNEVRGSNVYFADLEYLDTSLRQGRVHPQELDPPMCSLRGPTFTTTASLGSLARTLDMSRSTGVNWKIPKGFLNRYNASNHLILRRAAELGGALASTTSTRGLADVTAGKWATVEVPDFVQACRDVLGELSPEEEEYVYALALEHVPLGSRSQRIGSITLLDKSLQQGRTPTSIKGPVLLPTIFLNNTTSPNLDSTAALRYTGGRIR